MLTGEELRRLWAVIQALGYPDGPFLSLLLLTGQRRSEIASLRWDEFNERDKLIEFSGDRYKNRRPHVVPTAPMVLDVIAALPRFDGCAFAFTSTERGPINSFTALKGRVDAKITEAAGKNGVAPWVLHDLRRTVRTNLPKLGITSDIAERVMGHTIGGVRGVYDRFDYLPQKRHALEVWAQYLSGLVQPTAGKVIALQ